MTLEAKLRTLAAADPTLAGIFGSGSPLVFRWFDTQLTQQAVETGICAVALRVSTRLIYVQEGLLTLTQPRVQIDVVDLIDPEACRAAAAAIIAWLRTVDFASNAQFGSIATTPTQYPNFVLNQRGGMYFQVQPPAYVQSLDLRIFNLEE